MFGCKAFVRIPQDERLKIDTKTRQCIFLDYGLDKFGYKLFDPVAKKVVRSCDVVFVEDQTIEDIVKTKVQVPQQEPVVVYCWRNIFHNGQGCIFVAWTN